MSRFQLEPFFAGYLCLWLAACVGALVVLVRRRPGILSRGYGRFLCQPWKLATFVIAATGMTVIAPWTGDPTWDYFDALLMSLLTFVTAPWSVGILYRLPQRRASLADAYVAACLWLFSASWCYDLYLLWRDGTYPITWWSNLLASSILYLLAGMMWNLEWQPGRGGHFAFMEQDWPMRPANALTWRLAVLLLPIMLLVAALILPFLWGGWG